jgi:hypothetical protein
MADQAAKYRECREWEQRQIGTQCGMVNSLKAGQGLRAPWWRNTSASATSVPQEWPMTMGRSMLPLRAGPSRKQGLDTKPIRAFLSSVHLRNAQITLRNMVTRTMGCARIPACYPKYRHCNHRGGSNMKRGLLVPVIDRMLEQFYSPRVTALIDRIATQERLLTDYRTKLKGATPDEAASQIDKLTSLLADAQRSRPSS